jgi:lysine-specific demethylase 8
MLSRPARDENASVVAPNGDGATVQADLKAPVAFDPIPRIAAPSVEEFERDYVRRSRPVVITGVVGEWPAATRWSFDYFSSMLRDAEVVAIATREHRLHMSEQTGTEFRWGRLGEFVDALRRGDPDAYYVTTPLHKLPRSFFDDFVVPPYCARSPWLRPKLWIGRGGTVTPLHFDLPGNLSAQVFGRKLWVIYPPTQIRSLYPCSLWSSSPNFSRLDLESPDETRFPRFRNARPLGAVIAPGELLYVPRLWWHFVRAVDDNATMNFWFGGQAMAFAGRTINAMKRLTGVYPGEWG